MGFDKKFLLSQINLLQEKNVEIGDARELYTIRVPDTSITEIISVYDSDGNEYYEVDYLSQDTVYKSIKNEITIKTIYNNKNPL